MAAIHPNQACNCWLIAEDFGSKRVRVPKLSHGMDITGNTDSAKGYKAFYPIRRSKGSVSVSFVFPSYRSFDIFSKWMEAYGRRLASTNDQAGPMRVMIPAMNFNITAIPTSGWSRGDSVGSVVYTSTVNFDAAGTASDFENVELSRFRKPLRGWQDSRFFYPSGRQTGFSIADRLSSGSAPEAPKSKDTPDDIFDMTVFD